MLRKYCKKKNHFVIASWLLSYWLWQRKIHTGEAQVPRNRAPAGSQQGTGDLTRTHNRPLKYKKEKITERRNKQIYSISWSCPFWARDRTRDKKISKDTWLEQPCKPTGPNWHYRIFHPQGYMKHSWSFKRCLHFYDRGHVT